MPSVSALSVVRVGPLVGSAEIREMLGDISRQRVYQLTSRKGFPDPIAVLQMGKVWLRKDVEKWIASNRHQLDG